MLVIGGAHLDGIGHDSYRGPHLAGIGHVSYRGRTSRWDRS